MGVVDNGEKSGAGPLPAPQRDERPLPQGMSEPAPSDDARPEMPEMHMFLGMSMHGALRNQDPTKQYHFANKQGLYNVAYYKALGFKLEMYEGDDGVGLYMDQGSYELGSVIESAGQVLMSMPKERWAFIVAYVQGRADKIEEGYLSKDPGEVDVIRGRHGSELAYRKERVPQGFTNTQSMKTTLVAG